MIPAGTSWTDTGLVAESTHTYRVDAVDAFGNESALSAASDSITTPQGTGHDGAGQAGRPHRGQQHDRLDQRDLDPTSTTLTPPPPPLPPLPPPPPPSPAPPRHHGRPSGDDHLPVVP